MSDSVPTSEQTSRAIQLIGLLCDSPIDDEQFVELDQLVVQFPQLRRKFVELMSLHADVRQQAAFLKPDAVADSSTFDAMVDLVARQRLETRHPVMRPAQELMSANLKVDLNETLIVPAIKEDAASGSGEDDFAIDPPKTTVSPPANTRLYVRVAALIGLPLLTLSIYWLISNRSGHSSVAGDVRTSSCIITVAMNAIWSQPNDFSLKVGTAVTPGSHDLNAGVIKLELSGNAVVAIEAPARFEVLPDNKLRLLNGKLCAQLIKSGGLTVLTPDVTVIDTGTEFAIDVVDGKQTHVEVFQGAVHVTVANSTNLDGSKNVSADEAVIVTRGSSAVKTDTPRPLAFLRPSQLQTVDGTSYERWVRFSRDLRENPDLAAYYAFDADSVAANQLKNNAKQTAGYFNGTMGVLGVADSNPLWTQGRWVGKSALQFGGTKLKAVTVNAQQAMFPNKAMTLCCWIKRDDLDKPFHILTGETEGWRSFNLGVVRAEGANASTCINMTWAQYNVGSSPAPFNLNRWEFVTVTSTFEDGSEFYLDGKLISVSKSTSSSSVELKQMIIGAPTPGNIQSKLDDYFDGSIDELFLFRRALSGKEIEHLFVVGRPD